MVKIYSYVKVTRDMEYETYETEETYDEMNAKEDSKTKVQMQIYLLIRNN